MFDIEDWLYKNAIKNYSIRPDGIVDVDGNVDLIRYSGSMLPVQFGTVTGRFFAGSSDLTSLKGCPLSVGGYFSCSDTDILSLEHAPQSIKVVTHNPKLNRNCSSNVLVYIYTTTDINCKSPRIYRGGWHHILPDGIVFDIM